MSPDNQKETLCTPELKLSEAEFNKKATSAYGEENYEIAAKCWLSAYKLSGKQQYLVRYFDSLLMTQVDADFRGMQFSGLMLQYLVKNCVFKSVLDIGSGEGIQAKILRAKGKSVTEIDYGGSRYHISRTGNNKEDLLVGDFVNMDIIDKYDCVIASHVLEHQRNVGFFLDKAHSVLKEGGYLGITVPPSKSNIVGGHLSIWNAGLILYNLVLAGFDCKNAWVRKYGYNISVVIKKVSIKPEGLVYDAGDVDAIAKYLPEGFKEGFNGSIVELN